MTVAVNYTQGVDVSPRADRNLIYALVGRSAGVVERSDWRVTAAATGLRVRVAPGDIFITGDSINRQGTYHVWNDAEAIVQLNGAPATSPRFDIIGVQVIDSEYDAAASDARIVYLPGIPGAGGPVSIADQPGTIYVLAVVEVRVGVTAIADERIENRREVQLTSAPVGFRINQSIGLGVGSANPNRVLNLPNIRLDRDVDLLRGPLYLGITFPPSERVALTFTAFLDRVGTPPPGTPARIDADADMPHIIPNMAGESGSTDGRDTITIPVLFAAVPAGVWSPTLRVEWSGSANGTVLNRLTGVLEPMRQGPVT